MPSSTVRPDRLPVTGSTIYHLSAWLRGEIGAGGSPETGRWEVRVRFFDAGGAETGYVVTAAGGGAGSLNPDWRQAGELFSYLNPKSTTSGR